MNNRLVYIFLALFLLCCLNIPLSAPVLALKTPPENLPKPPTPDPRFPWEPSRSGIAEPYNLWDDIEKVNNTSPTSSEKIGNAFMAKKGQSTPVTTFTTDDEVSLVVQVSTSGWLYLLDYYVTGPDIYVVKDWLIFNVNLEKVGTYQTIQSTKLPLHAGKHICRLWFYDSSNTWSQKSIELTLTEAKAPQPQPQPIKPPPQQPHASSDNATPIKKPKPSIQHFEAKRTSPWSNRHELSWSVSGASIIVISPDIKGAKPVYDSREDQLKEEGTVPVSDNSTKYVLLAQNDGGVVSDYASIPAATVPWLYYVLIAAIMAAGGASGVVLTRRKKPLPPPIESGGERRPLPAKRAKLLLPNNMELPIGTGEKWLGRIDFARALAAPELRFISRQHFLIGLVNGGFYIEDSHSDNGTRLNDAEIRGRGRQGLHDGDRITVADAITVSFKLMPTPSARRDI